MTGKIRFQTWLVPELNHWNGYVGIPREHPLWGIGYSEALCGHPGCYEHTPERELKVHGGLTYSGNGKHFGAKDELWYFGFDTAHSHDDPRFGGTRKDEAYVIRECEQLVKQLEAWKGAKP